MRLWYFLPLLIIAALLISCGGDDDDNGVKPDTTPPTVVSTIPDDNAVNISPKTTISITFSEAMKTATINDSTFEILGGLAGTITYANNTATFTPDTDLVPGQTYLAAVTTGVEDVAGNALAENYVWQFTTADVILTNGPEYFPMADGDIWYYTDSLMQPVVRTVSGDTTIESRVCKRVLHDGQTTEAWTIIPTGDSAGFYVHLLDEILFFEPPLRIPFDMVFDAPYNYSSEVFWYSGDTLFSGGMITGTLKFKGYVTYDTPTGINFDDVLKFFYIPDGYYEHYARGVGLVDNENLVLDSAYVGGIWHRP